MASAILSGASASANSPQIVAESALLGQGGLLVKNGSINLTNGTITTTADATFTGLPNAQGAIYIAETPLPAVGSKQAWRFVVPASGGLEGQLGVVGYDFTTDPPTEKPVLRMSCAPRVGGAANQCILNFTAPLQSGTETIPLGGATIAVVNPAITASSLIVCSGAGAPDATAKSFNVVLNAGVGFSITAEANATAAKNVNYFIVKY